MDIRRQCDVDWSDWFCARDHAKQLAKMKIDPDLAKAFFTYSWALGRVRGTQACREAIEPFQELVG